MKKILTFAILAGIMFFVAGCGEKGSANTAAATKSNTENSYCEVSGERINLRNVKVISSGIEYSSPYANDWNKDGPIRRGYDFKSHLDYRGYIAFDDHKIYLNLEHYYWFNKLEEVQKQFESLR